MMWKIGLVGCGGVSSMHLDGCLERQDRVQLVAACDPDSARVDAARRKYDIAHGFSSLTEMIAGSTWDVAVVCTPTNIRLQVIRELAQAGKHIYVEKPMASSLSEAHTMVQVCAESGVQIAVDQNFRYFYPFHMAKTAIESGTIGRVKSILHVDTGFRQDAGWRVHETRHALSVMAVHWFDGFRWMLGEDPYAVYAQNRKSAAVNCAGETDSSVTLSFESGAIATCVQSFSSAVSQTSTVIIGDAGTIKLGYDGIEVHKLPTSDHVSVRVANPIFGEHGENKPASAFAGLDQLLSSIEMDVEPNNSGRDNLRTIAILEAAYESSQRSAVVSIAPVNKQ